MSGYHSWDQKDHADKWILFAKNIGPNLSIDETALTNGELYTIVTNKAGKGGRGSLVAIVEGIKAADIIGVLSKIPEEKRLSVKEVTLDMSNAMDAIIRASFKNADIVTDRFHVGQLVSEALQEVRGAFRRDALQEESEAIIAAKKEKKIYEPTLFANGDSKKQLLQRSFHLLFKTSSKWTGRQAERAKVLFQEFPAIHEAYKLSMLLRGWYENKTTKEIAKENLQNWYQKVAEKNIASFIVAARSIKAHEDTVLNYFNKRSTNASAESFNAKLKGFRALVRGVRDIKFFLFRVGRIFGEKAIPLQMICV